MALEHLDTIIAFVVIIAGVSLMVTLLTQMASAFLGLRGSNLRWGIATLLRELDPDLAEHAKKISQAVLEHPLVSDSTVSRSSLWLFRRWRLASAIRKEELIDILHSLAQPIGDQAAAPDASAWRETLLQALERLDPEPADNLVSAAPEIKKLFPNNPAKADQIVAQMMASAEHLTSGVHTWFDSVMDRVSQRFATHARIWTVMFSLLLAFALHLDAPRLLTQLSTDSELRARLASSADALQKRADEIAAPTASAPTSVDVNTIRSKADDLRSMLKDKQLQLIPDPYPHPFYTYWKPSWTHLWGVVASAALLSMGAPFWFNMLKTLANLRPVLANKEQEKS
jgi:hypothetical protein